MKLSELKKALGFLDEVKFMLPNGEYVPAHFHVTEVGKVKKDFIDCGGKVRSEETVSLQLWKSVDYYHRLKPQKLVDIIELSENKLGIEDHEVEVEYQGDTIGKYALQFRDGQLKLTNTQTACLASDACGVGAIKKKLSLNELKNSADSCCEPGSGCC